MSGIIFLLRPDIQNNHILLVIHSLFCFLRTNLLISLHCFLLLLILMSFHHFQNGLHSLRLLFLPADICSMVALLLPIISKLRMVSSFYADFRIIHRHVCFPFLHLLHIQNTILTSIERQDRKRIRLQAFRWICCQKHQTIKTLQMSGSIGCRHRPAQRMPGEIPVIIFIRIHNLFRLILPENSKITRHFDKETVNSPVS